MFGDQVIVDDDNNTKHSVHMHTCACSKNVLQPSKGMTVSTNIANCFAWTAAMIPPNAQTNAEQSSLTSVFLYCDLNMLYSS